MRDLLFKNLTSMDKRRKVLSSSEIVDKQGVRSLIRRHLICIVKEMKEKAPDKRPLPCLYVLKEHNDKEQKERFFCRVKGSMYAVSNGKLYLILFMHTLKITLMGLAQEIGG